MSVSPYPSIICTVENCCMDHCMKLITSEPVVGSRVSLMTLTLDLQTRSGCFLFPIS